MPRSIELKAQTPAGLLQRFRQDGLPQNPQFIPSWVDFHANDDHCRASSQCCRRPARGRADPPSRPISRMLATSFCLVGSSLIAAVLMFVNTACLGRRPRPPPPSAWRTCSAADFFQFN